VHTELRDQRPSTTAGQASHVVARRLLLDRRVYVDPERRVQSRDDTTRGAAGNSRDRERRYRNAAAAFRDHHRRPVRPLDSSAGDLLNTEVINIRPRSEHRTERVSDDDFGRCYDEPHPCRAQLAERDQAQRSGSGDGRERDRWCARGQPKRQDGERVARDPSADTGGTYPVGGHVARPTQGVNAHPRIYRQAPAAA